MAKEQAIIINNPQSGIAPSSFFGFEEIRGLNIKDKPGVAFPNKALTKESGVVVDDLIQGGTFDSTGNFYGFTQEVGNSIFKRDTSGTWTELSGFGTGGIAGIAYWKGYIIVIHLTGSLDASANGTTWTNAFDSINNNNNSTCPSIVAQDGNLYIGNENELARLVENTTFDPTSGATFTLTDVALDLPNGYDIKVIQELGSNLMLATNYKLGKQVADIFPWDTVSTSFDNPIRLKEEGIMYMLSINNLLYIFAGVRGRWYVSNGSSVQLFASIPTTLINLTGDQKIGAWNEACDYRDGLIYFGISNPPTSVQPQGIYSLNISSGVINVEHIISTGEVGAGAGVVVGLIRSAGITTGQLIVTWSDLNTPTYGADKVGTTGYTGNVSFLTSSFLGVGMFLNKKTFSSIEIELTQPLASGDSVKLEYRTARNGSWTEIKTFDTVGQQTLYTPFGKSDLTSVQFRISLNKNAEFFMAKIK